MTNSGREVERCATILVLKTDVTVSRNELFRDGLMPFSCRFVERRAPVKDKPFCGAVFAHSPTEGRRYIEQH